MSSLMSCFSAHCAPFYTVAPCVQTQWLLMLMMMMMAIATATTSITSDHLHLADNWIQIVTVIVQDESVS